MKRIFQLLFINIFFLYGCITDEGYISSNNQNDNNTPQVSSSPQSSNNNQNPISTSNIRIPSTNGTAPNGILDQLAWAGRGGLDGPEQPCGDCSIVINGSSILLNGFEPYQVLELIIYRESGGSQCLLETAEYVTSATVQVDQNGSANLKLIGDINNIFVGSTIDLNTNESPWIALGRYEYFECSESVNSCPGAPPQRLIVNEMAYVCTTNDSVKLREGPGKNYPILKSLVPGSDIKIIGGPLCGDNWSWWEVETESGYTGWMTEGGDNVDKYFLCPAP